MSKILITGGTGYIGSHTAIELIGQGSYEVVSIDNHLNSSAGAIDRVEKISGQRYPNYEVDLCDLEATREVFKQHPDISGVIHFAALKAVGESVEKPLYYYHNNFQSLVNILKCCDEFGVKHFIFSSSCSVYGEIDELPVTENTLVTTAASPYGNTKLVGEQIIRDYTRNSETACILLRYFNPVGAHVSGLNGEDPINRPSNLLPVITQTAAGIIKQMTVHGHDYDTRDGTCIRDYIHVTDIANAHIKALEYLVSGRNEDKHETFNLGTGKGVSVLEAIKAFEGVTGMKLNYELGPRRPGDVPEIFANNEKARKALDWVPEIGLEDMMRSAWKWQNTLST